MFQTEIAACKEFNQETSGKNGIVEKRKTKEVKFNTTYVIKLEWIMA
jgi:hypothetical protein